LKDVVRFKEMPFGNKSVVQLKVNRGENPIPTIESILAKFDPPDLVFLDVSSIDYPRRTMDLSKELVEYVNKNPKVKIVWDGKNLL
jgi:hypothetical protein